MRISFFAVLALVAGCGTASSGGGADMATGGDDLAIVTTVPTNFASINQDIIMPTCAKFSVCHNTAGSSDANMLDLSQDPYKALVNVAAVNAKAMSMGLLRVKPCDADHSFMQIKISLTTDLDTMTDYGHHMPQVDGEFLTGAQIQAIKDWINRGALENEPADVSGSTCQLFQDMGSVDSH
jgi:hypothetical protein